MLAPILQIDPLSQLGQALANGLAFGSLYALAALSLVLIYRASATLNFANGEMAMFSAFVAFFFLDTLHLPYWLAFILALIFAAGLGNVIYRSLIKPLQTADHLSQLLATVGLGVLLTGLAGWIWGFDNQNFPDPISGPPLKIGSIIFTETGLLRIGLAIVLALGLFWFFRFTFLGIALRALAENPTAASLMGINVDRLKALAWMMAASLGAIAGMLIAPDTFLEPLMMSDVAIKAFAAAVLGGLTSLPGALVGGLAVGIIDNLVGTYLSSELRDTFAFAIIIGILLVRPAGLFGRSLVKKV